jgi:hypothetical protein
LAPEADAFGQLDGGAVPTSLTLLEPSAAAPNGIVYLRYGLAEGIPLRLSVSRSLGTAQRLAGKRQFHDRRLAKRSSHSHRLWRPQQASGRMLTGLAPSSSTLSSCAAPARL